ELVPTRSTLDAAFTSAAFHLPTRPPACLAGVRYLPPPATRPPATLPARNLPTRRSWGYEPIILSCETGQGVEQVAQLLQGRISAVAGPSGSGKSSLINSLRLGRHRPDLLLSREGDANDDPRVTDAADDDAADRELVALEEAEGCGDEEEGDDETAANAAMTHGKKGGKKKNRGGEEQNGKEGGGSSSAQKGADVSDPRVSGGSSKGGADGDAAAAAEFLAVGDLSRTGRGMHTTTAVRLLPLLGGGWLADTPGFGQPTLEDIPSSQLASCFPELAARVAASPCRFRDCMHVAEPGCTVRQALEAAMEEREREEQREREAAGVKEEEEVVAGKAGAEGRGQAAEAPAA
ncbi:hypothetical protein Agub_g3438, partial [Astrephomene gubernaculifera]